MKLRDLFRWGKAAGGQGPRASGDGGTLISSLTSGDLEAFVRHGSETHSGAVVSDAGAMRIAAAWRCVHILAGVCGNNPLDLYRRVDERTRVPADDHPLREVLTRRPNSWQTPSEFRKMLTAWMLLEGNGYALKIVSRGRILELWPLNSRRVEVVQNDDMTLSYRYTRKNGSQITLQQSEVMHLRGLTMDGVRGMGVLQHARECLGLALQGEKAGAMLFRQGVLAAGALKSPNALSDQAYSRLKDSLEEQNAGAENAHKLLILEEGLDAAELSMTAADAQFLESRKFQRSDIYMFFGVPPFLTGDVEKTTSWGSGVEQMGTAFKQYSAQDHTTMWEETIERDLLDPVKDARVYVMLDLRGLLRGDSTGRANYYSRALGGGGNKAWMTVNEVRALEDLNPLTGGDVLPEPSTNPQPLTKPPPGDGEKD